MAKLIEISGGLKVAGFAVCIVGILSVIGVEGEVFTSAVDLEGLIYLRREINRAIDVYMRKEEQRLEYIRERLKASKGLATGGSGDDSGNPINAFLLVKGLSVDLSEVITVAGDRANFKELGTRLETLHKTTAFPDLEDISGAALGLIRLQDTYKLDAKAIAKGAIGDSCCAPELTLEDCFELGRQSYNAKSYEYAIQWFKEALVRFPDEEGFQNNNSFNTHNDTNELQSNGNANSPMKPVTRIAKAEILNYLTWSEDIQNTLDVGKDFLAQLTGLKLDAFLEQVAQAVTGLNDDSNMTQKDLDERYKSLCRGDYMEQSSVNPLLKCYYSTRNNPFYVIGPVKEELLNVDPPIWSFKDVIHPGEMKRIQEIARPRFETAMVVNVLTGVNERSNSRISKSAWLTKGDGEVVKRIDARTGFLTQLSMESAELLQIANYGIGGMYLPHYDFALPGQEASFLEKDRNRIATMLYYMSDVEKGGATVFPKLNLTLWPEKGNAVFWFNLKKSGEGDLRTQHAACPVLVGSKWVSNKWIHEKGQEFRYKCGLQRND